MNSDKKNQDKKQTKGIENIRFLYLVILTAIIGIVIINFQVNVVWLRGFAASLRNSSIEYEYSQAHHAAGMMEEEANAEIDIVESLAHNVVTVGLDSPQAEIFIEDFLKKNNHTREISIIDLDGQEKNKYSRETSSSVADLKDFSNLEQFEKAKQGETYMSRVNYSSNMEPYVIITTPVRNLGHEEPQSVLQGKYFLRGMWEIALEMKIGSTGRISVFDDKGMLVADPKPSRVLKKVNLLNLPPVKPALSKNKSNFKKSDTNGTVEMSGMAEHSLASRSVSEDKEAHYLNENNVEVLGIAVPLNIRGMSWGVLVEQDASEIEAPLREVSKWLIIFLVGNLAIIAILSWLILILRKANQKLMGSQYVLEIAKERAEDEKNKTDSIIANFIDPVIVVDSSWHIILLNAAAKKVFNLSDGDLGKRTETKNGRFSFSDFRKLIPVKFEVKESERDNRGFPTVEEVVVGNRTGEKILPESALTGSFSNELIYKVITRAVCDENRICYGHMKIFYDLTREKMVDRMKSDFISIVAHQLRTPLSAIKWAVGMVLDEDAGKINPEQANFLRKGYESNERMIILVNDMLNVSRIEEGRFGFVFSKSSFQEVLNDVITGVEGLIAKKHLRITLDKETPLPELYLDREKIKLAFQNILDNAIKYTPDYGEIKIILKTLNGSFEVRVRDNGIGIPEADKKRIFSKFFRSANVVKMETEGSGLGLFIVKNIIDKHGGKIFISSEEGKGTEVAFSLPLDRNN